MRVLKWLTPLALGSFATICAAGEPQLLCGRTDHFFVGPNYSAAGAGVNPLYTAPNSGGANPLYGGKIGSPRTGSLPSTLSGYRAVGSPSYSPGGGGRIAVRFVSSAPGDKPIIARFDSDLNYTDSYLDLDSDNDGIGDLLEDSRAPVIADDGAIIFKSVRGGQTNILARYPLGSQVTGTIPNLDIDSATNVSRPAVRPDGGEVVFAAEHRATDGSGALTQGLYAGRPGSSLPITIFGEANVRYSDPQVDATGGVAFIETNAAGESAVVYAPRDAASGRATGKRQHSPNRPNSPTNPITFSLSRDGSMLAFVDNGALSLVTSPRDAASGLPTGISTTMVLASVGDTVGTTTLASISLAPDSFNAATGLLYFSAAFGDGGSGIFSVTVPEPMTLGSLASVGILMMRRWR